MIYKEDKELLIKALQTYKSFGIQYIDDFSYHNLRSSHDKLDLPDDFNQLAEFIEHCSLCELSKLTNKKTIGYGNPVSKIYFIDQALNIKDKKIMLLLEAMLRHLEISFQEIYITNIIKCTLDLSKDNKEKFCDSCKEYTFKQIDIKSPSVILTFGDTWKYFLKLAPSDSITYGRQYQYKDIVLFPMFDLEFLYKNPSYNDDMIQHLEKVKGYLNSD